MAWQRPAGPAGRTPSRESSLTQFRRRLTALTIPSSLPDQLGALKYACSSKHIERPSTSALPVRPYLYVLHISRLLSSDTRVDLCMSDFSRIAMAEFQLHAMPYIRRVREQTLVRTYAFEKHQCVTDERENFESFCDILCITHLTLGNRRARGLLTETTATELLTELPLGQRYFNVSSRLL
jgi:hypothetical protein